MTTSLKRLGVDMEKTDLFITHLHADHLGLAGTLATETSTVFFNEIEARMINASREEVERRWERLSGIFAANGFPEGELKESVAGHPGRRYSGKKRIDFSVVREGDTIERGDYSFQCIETPGHSPGHLCLYEAKKKILVCGDHILFDITPNITFWEELEDSLRWYLTSLEKVYDLDVALVLPGHRSLMNNHQKRIKQLQEHHQNRLSEALSALRDGQKTAYEVAAYITWDIKFNSWEEFPAQQKWFAFGETLAHLKYLEAQGMVQSEKQGGNVLFCRCEYMLSAGAVAELGSERHTGFCWHAGGDLWRDEPGVGNNLGIGCSAFLLLLIF